MVSRRKILSRSYDDLDLMDEHDEDGPSTLASTGASVVAASRGGSSGGGGRPAPPADEEDVWHSKDKLYRDHIQEVLNKWEHIDDEIWAKVIVMERNKRVAKAYARAPVLTVNGSDDGFDGYRIGLRGFDSGLRDQEAEEIRRLVGHGVKFKMDASGNILVKRVSRSPVLVMNAALDETAASSEIMKLARGALPFDKPETLFDVRKFRQNVERELKRAYPDRRKLENQCVSAISFVHGAAGNLLACPVWVLLINMVAMDMLKAKLPPMMNKRSLSSSAALNKNTPAIHHGGGSSEEDPYSLSGSATSGGSSSSGKDLIPLSGPSTNGGPSRRTGTAGNSTTSRQDSGYSSNSNINAAGKTSSREFNEDPDARMRQLLRRGHQNGRVPGTSAGNKKKDDPYYCGLRAKQTKPRLWDASHMPPTSTVSAGSSNNNRRSHPPTTAAAFHHSSHGYNSNERPFYPLKTGGLVGANPANRLLHHSRTVPAMMDEQDSEWENLWDA